MFTPTQNLIAETAAAFEKDYDGQEVEDVIYMFLQILEENGGKLTYPSRQSGPARTVHVGCATSTERSGVKRTA